MGEALMRSLNYGKRRRPHTGPEVYLVGFERRDGLLHALLWGPGTGDMAMPVGDEQPRGRVRVEMPRPACSGWRPMPDGPARAAGAPQEAREGFGRARSRVGPYISCFRGCGGDSAMLTGHCNSVLQPRRETAGLM